MITRDVEVRAVADLAFRPPRAALAAVVDGGVLVLPVNVTMEDPLDLVSSPRIVQVPSGSPNVADRDVVVVADDGPQWFRLRSLTVRGTAKTIDDRAYRLVPKRIVAWDYGSLREVSTPSGGRAALRAPWSDTEQEDDLEAFQSPNLQAAMRKSRVMILASRSRQGLPFGCGSFLTMAAFMRRPRRHPGRHVTWPLARRWPYCSAARAETAPIGSWSAETAER